MEHEETERYDPQAIEAKWQARLGRRARLRGRRIRTCRPSRAGRQVVRPRDAPVPLGRAPHGAHASTTRSATSSRTCGAGRGSPCCGPMGYDSFGLPAENAAIKEGGHPREITKRNIEAIRRQMKRMGWAIDWSREVSTARARVLPLDAVAVPAVLRARARVPQGGARQVVPERPDRARERAGDRRPLRALRHRGRVAEPDAVVLPDHRLRRRAARRDGHARVVARARADDAAQLDRPLGGRPGHLPGRRERARSCRCSRRGPTRSSARRSSCSRPSTRWSPS